MHCHQFYQPTSRRDMLRRSATGFGSLALSALLQTKGFGASQSSGLHFPAKCRNVIFLYMDGGVSQVDSFDPKPLLEKEHGKPFAAKMEPTQFDNIGTTFKSPWSFSKRGQSGAEVSDLFPFTAQHVDKMTIVRSMIAEFSEHQTANFFLHTGTGLQGRPSMGAWINYGLGSESENLPGFVVINGGLIPSGGLDNFGSGFLPAAYQASIFKPADKPLANISRREKVKTQLAKIDLMRQLDQRGLNRMGHVDQLESAIVNYEKAFRMQTAVPELANLNSETEATREMYGLNHKNKPTQIFGRECLIARRLVERGVRFVELTCPHTGNDRWDAHSNIAKNHADNALAVDQPIGALLTRLGTTRALGGDARVVFWRIWSHTVCSGLEGARPQSFRIFVVDGRWWIKQGLVYGATDEFGYHAIENRTEMYDLHATILHLMGMDHERLTYRFSGRDMRLTDVHGKVVHDILA